MLYKNQPLIEAIKNCSTVEIRAGKDRTEYTEIWVVHVGARIFARSWNFSEKSWYTAMLETGKGELKCGSKKFVVKGYKPKDPGSVHPRINAAYLAKYDEGENSEYARGIIGAKYWERTMEFELVEQLN